MQPKLKSHNYVMLIFILLLFFSCSTFNESVLEPEKGAFLMPVIFLQDPVGDLGYKIPKSAIQMLKDKSRGSVIKSENIDGLEKLDAISVIITKLTPKYVYILVDNEESITLNKNDGIVNYIPESLIKINETHHKFLVEAFKEKGI